MVASAIRSALPRQIDIAIAEADIVRSQIRIDALEKCAIATRSAYTHSVGVLPVSRVIEPKFDLKEILERKKMISCVRARYSSSGHTLVDKTMGRIYEDAIRFPTEIAIKDLQTYQLKISFRGTSLSNFYEIPTVRSRSLYASVEHAYQAAKFPPNALERVGDKEIHRINSRLASRGVTVTKESLPSLFEGPELTAGASKIAANELRIMGYVRDDWDYVKLRIMTELLIQKFSNDSAYRLLQETAPKYLVEGNDWGDTYWGFTDGRGRNFLGRLIMQIRANSIETLKEEADRLEPERPSN
ncbi:hypothetical protein GCM10010873_11080 [Cypionkella aquatica]|uniref:NADAR domain-containing protein n=2 Tax=Cypionkella aquatica TaxID=1756042 RepID=A0AA37WZV3_9RHOB|nr:hypothetical protein GCM10010873_11080 [Cypionkella aquatica]